MEPPIVNKFSYRLKNTFKNTFILLKDGFRDYVISPAKWRWFHWIAALVFLAATVAAYYFKWPIYFYFYGGSAGVLNAVAAIGRNFGDFETPLVLSLTLVLLGSYLDRKNWMDAGAVLLAAMGIAGVFTLLGQFVLAEHRPYEGGLFELFKLNGHGVSGHATSSAVIVIPLSILLLKGLRKNFRIALIILLIGWAVLVAWSRLFDSKHFLWNVMLGAANGIYSGHISVKAYRKRNI